MGIEVGGRYINDALNRTTGDIRQIADVMVTHAEAGLRHWLEPDAGSPARCWLAFGVLVAILGGLGKKA